MPALYLSLSVPGRSSGGVCSEQHRRLLLVQRDSEHFNNYRWGWRSAVVDGASLASCLDSALCLLHPGHRDHWKGLKVTLHLSYLMWEWCLLWSIYCMFVQIYGTRISLAHFVILTFFRLSTSPPLCRIWSSLSSLSEDWLWRAL